MIRLLNPFISKLTVSGSISLPFYGFLIQLSLSVLFTITNKISLALVFTFYFLIFQLFFTIYFGLFLFALHYLESIFSQLLRYISSLIILFTIFIYGISHITVSTFIVDHYFISDSEKYREGKLNQEPIKRE